MPVPIFRFPFFVLFAVILCYHDTRTSHAFVPSYPHQRRTQYNARLFAGGMGMGTAVATKNGKKKNGKTNKNNGSGSGKKKVAVFDVNASLLRLEKKYDELAQASAKFLNGKDDDEDGGSTDTTTSRLTSEMVVAVRAAPSKAKTAATSDWVPVAQLCLRPHAEVSSEWAQAAVSLYCRELSHAATLASKVFSTVPRNDIQYAIESTDSFHKFVYDSVVEDTRKNGNKNSNKQDENCTSDMTKAQARQVLELSATEHDKSVIKKAYRTKSFQWHPDRLRDHSEEHMAQGALEYARIQKAYEVLTSGVRTLGSSWYASLGGRERTDFRPIELLGQDVASAILKQHNVESAIVGLDSELVQTFVARNQAAKNP